MSQLFKVQNIKPSIWKNGVIVICKANKQKGWCCYLIFSFFISFCMGGAEVTIFQLFRGSRKFVKSGSWSHEHQWVINGKIIVGAVLSPGPINWAWSDGWIKTLGNLIICLARH